MRALGVVCVLLLRVLLKESHRLEAASDNPRHQRQEAAAVQQMKSLRPGCSHLLTAVQPHTQNRYHLSLPFV